MRSTVCSNSVRVPSLFVGHFFPKLNLLIPHVYVRFCERATGRARPRPCCCRENLATQKSIDTGMFPMRALPQNFLVIFSMRMFPTRALPQNFLVIFSMKRVPNSFLSRPIKMSPSVCPRLRCVGHFCPHYFCPPLYIHCPP